MWFATHCCHVAEVDSDRLEAHISPAMPIQFKSATVKVGSVDDLIGTRNELTVTRIDDGSVITDADRDLRQMAAAATKICQESLFHCLGVVMREMG